MPVYFGTDGIRAVAGKFPLTPRAVKMLGQALGTLLAARYKPARIILGRDTRESGIWIARSLIDGLSSAGCEVISAGIITTPGVAYITRLGFSAGIVVSASHNPYTDNGIKIFSADGTKLSENDELAVEAVLYDYNHQLDDEPPTTEALSIEEDNKLVDHYIEFLAEAAQRLSLKGKRIGVDCANGAATGIAPQLLRRLGAEVYTIGCSPNGRNINAGCGSLHLEALSALVKAKQLDLGIAFDGDADRVLLVDATGSAVDGDKILLILAKYLKMQGKLQHNTVVATLMSNFGLERALAAHGLKLHRVAVGDKYVFDALRKYGFSLGGEQSGHVIIPAISPAGDGILTAICVLKALQELKTDFHAATEEMISCPQMLINVNVRHKIDFSELPRVAAALADAEQKLQGSGRVLLRYSGTEMLARVMVEGEDRSLVEQLASSLAETIRQEIG
ncbi:MAG: phosphoglucosamine mutase [Acidobacteriota bacterium]|nr:phosphoglucosamine mutase [Blastocatellia bacterium]MDW8411831.1 phosphoglucosamine mutase [Acidobacteriota bacterium]